jgi:hypothetical protein
MVPGGGGRRPAPYRGAQPLPQDQGPKTQWIEDYFAYAVLFTNLVHGTTQTQAIQIQADSDFKWIKGEYFAVSAGASVTDPQVTAQILDQTNGRNLFQIPLPVPSVFGIGTLPHIEPVPRIFNARSAIQFTVANVDAANDFSSLWLVLEGTRIFKQGPNT